MNTIVKPIARMSRLSSETSCSTSTRSTTTCVNTGNVIWSTLTMAARASARQSSGRCGRTNGHIQVMFDAAVGAVSNCGVYSNSAAYPDQRAANSSRGTRRSPSAGSARPTCVRVTSYTTSQWSASQCAMAGRGMRSRFRSDVLTERVARPSSSPAWQSDRRLVPSSPVFTSCRIRERLTCRPKWRQMIARHAAPQSISSICRTIGTRRMRPRRLMNRPSASNGAASGDAATGSC